MGMNYMPKWHLIGHFAVVGMGERNLGGENRFAHVAYSLDQRFSS